MGNGTIRAGSVQVGDRSGLLTARRVIQKRVGRMLRTFIECDCECGAVRTIRDDHFRTRPNIVCRCKQERVIGHRYTRKSWEHMIDRCYNTKHPQYHRYGGRGICVCDRWRQSFAAFIQDMGPRPDGTSIDRIDNDGNYEPWNCRWQTPALQNRNKSNAAMIEWDGVVRSVTEWSEVTGIPRFRIFSRLRAGWTPVDALTLPPEDKGFRVLYANRLEG